MRTPLLTLATLCLCTGGVHAQALVEVAQESSPNAGDFDANVLGTIQAYDTALTAPAYYQWNANGLASFNGPAPAMASNTSKVFFLDGADGLSVVVLHDAVKENGNDGEAGMRFEVMGDPDGLTRTVEDDPNGESPNDQYTGNAGDTVFTSQQSWFSCCADGTALTGLDGAWTLLAEFTDADANPLTSDHRNLFFWHASSGDGTFLPMTLVSDRRVRFRHVEPKVEPCGTGDCFADNGTPGCEDEACCLTVCGLDGFCCDSVWDAACAALALAECEGAPVPTEACCFFDGTCEDLSVTDCTDNAGTPQGAGTLCETTVCVINLPCPGEGDCYTGNGTVGCADADCCSTVCGVDTYCCEVEWDDTCAQEALDFCTEVPGRPGEGDCYSLDNVTPGCDDESCCSTVCAEDNFCCNVEWDGNCVEIALDACDNAPDGDCSGDGDCYTENGTPGCADTACCETVCAGDSFCCVVLWDDACVEDAVEFCETPTESCCLADNTCIETEPGLCAFAGGTAQGPGSSCDTTICAPAMQACCLTEETCVVALIEACQAAGGTLLGPDSTCEVDACVVVSTDEACCVPNVGCIELDPGFCLVTGGDAQGPGTTCATTNCDPSCPGEGDCLEGNGTPGCANEACCTAVCALDSFCCDTQWDGKCADDAMLVCEAILPRACCLPGDSCQDLALSDCILGGGTVQPLGSSCADDGCTPPCVGDINGDSTVNIDDLVLLILDFGQAGPDLTTDLNGDFMVNIDDVVILVVAFGPCNVPE